MNDKHKESFEEIYGIMTENKIKESDKGAFLTAFSLGMAYATNKMKSYVETNNLLKGVAK